MLASTSAARRLAWPVALLLVLLMASSLLRGLQPELAGWIGPEQVRLLDRVIIASLWLALAWLLVRLLDVLVWSRRARHLPRLLTDLLAALILLTAALAIAAVLFEVPLAGILTTSGVAVAVLGFALRDMLASLFAGIALNLERPYRIGDWLEVQPDTVGRVEEVGWLTTRLVTQDGIGLVVPNAQLATRAFRNFDQPMGPWRDHLTVTLGYEVSPARAERILLAAAATVAAIRIEGHRPDARIAACGEHGVVWDLRYWVPSYAARIDLRHQLHAAVLHHLYKAGIGPAHRRLDLFHAPMPPRMVEHRAEPDLLLARSDLFGSLPPPELKELAHKARRVRVPAGSAAVRQGEPGSSMFVVLEGVLDVTLEPPSGPRRWLREFVPGDMFGEFSLLTGDPRSATVTARTDSLLFEIGKADLMPLMERYPELAERLSGILAYRQADRATGRSEAAEPPPAPARRTDLLGRIRDFFGLPDDRG